MTVATLSRWAGLVSWLLFLAVATLTTGPALMRLPDMSVWCLICGSRGSGDAILNVVLFMPLGWIMRGFGRPALQAAAVALALSVTVESLQFAQPGRFPTLGDVVWNGLGGWIGAILADLVGRRVRRPDPGHAPVAAAAAASLVLVIAGLLLTPLPSTRPYYGQWTPELYFMPEYRGELVDAAFQGARLPNGRFPADADPRSELLGRWTLEALIVKGPPPESVSPIANLYDDIRREVVLLGADGEDVVLREWTRASTLRFDQPDVRLPNGLASHALGDTVSLAVERIGDRRCLSVDEAATCLDGIPFGRSWALLLHPEWLAHRAHWLDLIWLALLTFPVGFLTGSLRGAGAPLVVLGAGVGSSAWLTRLAAPLPVEVAAILGGFAIGVLVLLTAKTASRSANAPAPAASHESA